MSYMEEVLNILKTRAVRVQLFLRFEYSFYRTSCEVLD